MKRSSAATLVDDGRPQRASIAAVTADDRTDAALVRGCLDGDEQAWSALLDRYKRLVYSIPIKYGFSAEEATDIFQETCVELLTELPRLREPRALPKWLAQVAAHKCLRLKTRAQRQAAPLDDYENVHDVADARALAEDVLLQVEREQGLRTAVAGLPDRCRRLVEMLFFEHPPRPYREVADALAIASGSIGFIRGRCLSRLRAELRKHGVR